MKRIRVVLAPYEDVDGDFPESDHYPNYVARALTERYPGADIDVDVGGRTWVIVSSDGDDAADIEHDVKAAVQVELWDAFCADGYKAYSAPTCAGRLGHETPHARCGTCGRYSDEGNEGDRCGR